MCKLLFLFSIIFSIATSNVFGAGYLIITHDNFYDCILPLAKWKAQKGLVTKVVKLSTIGANVNDIKNYIQNAYNTWNPKPRYILLVGDIEWLPSYYHPTYGFYTDNYYAKLIGSDILADVCIGRFSVDSPQECSTLVAKTLYYECYPYIEDKHWFKRAVLIVNEDGDADDYLYYYPDAEFSCSLLIKNGFTDIDTLYSSNGVDSIDLLHSVNNGCTFVGYRGSSVNQWYPPFRIDPNKFQNGFKLPIVISATCLTGLFEEDYSDCERWTRAGDQNNPKGAIAYLATPIATTGSAAKRSSIYRNFWRALFIDNNFILGEVFLKEKERFWNEMGNEEEYEGWHLFGDPELNIWTDVPKTMYVSHPFSIPVGNYSLRVSVTSNGLPVNGAIVSFLKDTIPFSSYTDNFGNVTLPVYTSDTGIAYLTVTGHNLIPYKSYIFVGSECEILKPNLKPQYHIYRGYHRIGYRATKFTPVKPCYLVQLLVGVASLENNASKECKIYVWRDDNGSPGTEIFSGKLFLDAPKNGYIYWQQFNLSPFIEINSSFWVGIQELDTLFPTLVFDMTNSLPTKIKNEGGNWTDTNFDWFHCAVVGYKNLKSSYSQTSYSSDSKLFQNYPNPFTSETIIKYCIPKEYAITQQSIPLLKIYDITGRVIRIFVSEFTQPGLYQVVWDGKDSKGNLVNSGVYFYKLIIGDYTETKKMIMALSK